MMGSDEKTRVCLGTVIGTHGIRGEVRIKTYTERPEDIAAYGRLDDETGRRSFDIVSVRTTKGDIVVARIKGVEDRDAAENLKGITLHLARSSLPEPDNENEWYHADLIDLNVITMEGEPFGKVVAVQNFGAGDLLEIRQMASRQTIFLPFTSELVPEIDLDRGQIIINPPEEISGEEKET